jgi:uncharacterized protein YigE (DUF2233 family)
MSKRSLFWGQASGKLGEAVFYRANGEQRTRSYVAKIANPKTLAQMSNRVAMLNLVSGYRSISSVLGKSFIDKRYNESDYNAFIRNSKNANTAGITRLQAQVGWCCPYGFAISRGKIAFSDLLSFFPEAFGNSAALSLAGTKAGMTVNQLLDLNDNEGPNGYTGGQLYQVIVGNNNPINLPTRFKLNYVIGAANGDAWDLAVYQIEIYSGSTDTLHLIAGKEVFGGAKKLINLHTNDAESDLPMTHLNFSLNASGLYDAESTFVGLFISSTTSGKLDVSSANMYVSGGAENESVAEHLPGGTVWQDILAEMGYVPNSVLA